MDDLEFVRRCVRGDKQSWEAFVDKYSRLIFKLIYSVLKTKGCILQQENIHDLFQEIFLLLLKDNFKKLKSYKARNGCSLASWLRQVTVNYTIDYLRRLRPAVSLDEENDEGSSLTETIADDAPDISDMLGKKEQFLHLKDCIKGLENGDKYFLELYINQGLTLEELRDYFRISRGAVDMRKSRIIERLRECFKSKGFGLDF